MLKKIPHTYTIIFSIILLCAVLSWIIPAGEYSRHTVEVNGTTRSVIVDNSYHAVEFGSTDLAGIFRFVARI